MIHIYRLKEATQVKYIKCRKEMHDFTLKIVKIFSSVIAFVKELWRLIQITLE